MLFVLILILLVGGIKSILLIFLLFLCVHVVFLPILIFHPFLIIIVKVDFYFTGLSLFAVPLMFSLTSEHFLLQHRFFFHNFLPLFNLHESFLSFKPHVSGNFSQWLIMFSTWRFYHYCLDFYFSFLMFQEPLHTYG